jgi:hypothetical protein
MDKFEITRWRIGRSSGVYTYFLGSPVIRLISALSAAAAGAARETLVKPERVAHQTPGIGMPGYLPYLLSSQA